MCVYICTVYLKEKFQTVPTAANFGQKLRPKKAKNCSQLHSSFHPSRVTLTNANFSRNSVFVLLQDKKKYEQTLFRFGPEKYKNKKFFGRNGIMSSRQLTRHCLRAAALIVWVKQYFYLRPKVLLVRVWVMVPNNVEWHYFVTVCEQYTTVIVKVDKNVNTNHINFLINKLAFLIKKF